MNSLFDRWQGQIKRTAATANRKTRNTNTESHDMRNALGIFALIAALTAQPLCALADETDTPVNGSVAQVIKVVGGKEKLLDVFRFHERVLITSTPTPQVAGETKGNRTSVVKVGGGWRVGTNRRNKDKQPCEQGFQCSCRKAPELDSASRESGDGI